MESRGEERSACLLHHRGLENSGGPLAESSQRKGSDLPEGVAVPLLVLVAVCWRSWGGHFFNASSLQTEAASVLRHIRHAYEASLSGRGGLWLAE